ncbi:unnamed protein product [Prunus armeniaca]
MALLGSMLIIVQLSMVVLLGAAIFTPIASAAKALLPQAKPGCPEKCGNLTIPYPFGIGDGCYLRPEFNITCNQASTHPTYLTRNNLSITNFYFDEAELQIAHDAADSCHDALGNPSNSTSNNAYYLMLPPLYTISETKNKLFVIGCEAFALLDLQIADPTPDKTKSTQGYSVAACDNILTSNNKVPDTCSGIACTESGLVGGLVVFEMTLIYYSFGEQNRNETKWFYEEYPCNYAFLVEDSKFTYAPNTSFQQLSNNKQLPVVINWKVGDEPCDVVEKSNNSLCKGNSKCVDWSIVHGKPGYICNCSEGYHGNPYLTDGCQDIDECETSNPCDNGTCHNLDGSYYCKCNSGYRNHDPKTCIPGTKSTALKISLGVCLSFLVLLVLVFWIYCGVKRRKFKKQQEKFFKQNGGLLLRQQLTRYNGSIETASIFSEEELKKMTDHYDEKRKIGEGGYGLVYKGTLPADKREVAIKMSKVSAPITDSLEFANEVILLSQINHKNVVKLLGCCLETQTPILVYEFISNGTLYDHLHGKDGKEKLSLESRLKIASGTAEALSYLHHSISNPIIHRDVKAMNILLDKNYVAKVADFGASRLVLEDQNQLATLVQGTLGYLDPEYLQSHILTDKSDVYSFGVVLAELLTGKKALIKKKNEAENLANVFVSAMKEGRLAEILDADLVKEEHNFETIVEKVANLANKCLALRGEERPPMNEVAVELLGLVQIMGKNTAGEKADDIQRSSKDSDHLLGSPAANYYNYVLDVRGEVGDSDSIATTTARRPKPNGEALRSWSLI